MKWSKLWKICYKNIKQLHTLELHGQKRGKMYDGPATEMLVVMLEGPAYQP
jgi:hypothetical protein